MQKCAHLDQVEVIGGTWHTDHSYDLCTLQCSILNAKELPPFGGDTHFASMAAAYRSLSPGLQNMLKNRAWHSDSSFQNSNVDDNPKENAFHDPTLHQLSSNTPIPEYHVSMLMAISQQF